MKWRQIPKPWREVVYDLKPGEHSGVIAGPRGRYWLVQVLDRRVSPPVSLADFREQIGEELRGQQVEALRTKLDREIRDGARIER
jgi:bifunctional DNA-binding transcriptional regulator/antitoxin component of YhaV-PrlF toxin-antitoxin module